VKCRVRENWQSGPSGKVAALDTPRTRAHAGTGCRCVNRIMSVLCRYKCPWCPRSVRRTWGWERQLGGSAAQWRGRAIGGRDVTPRPAGRRRACYDLRGGSTPVQHTRGKRHRQRSHTLTSSSNIEPLHPRRCRQKLTGRCPLCRVEVRVRDRPQSFRCDGQLV
jgi:hypothetical protein